MKSTVTAILMGIALTAFAAPVQAQYRATGDDGITASPKHREVLDARKAAVAAPKAVKKMACASCKDEVVTRVDYTARGVNKPTITAVKHLCDGCETSLKVVGHGKAAKSVATHSCSKSNDGKADCCKGAI